MSFISSRTFENMVQVRALELRVGENAEEF